MLCLPRCLLVPHGLVEVRVRRRQPQVQHGDFDCQAYRGRRSFGRRRSTDIADSNQALNTGTGNGADGPSAWRHCDCFGGQGSPPTSCGSGVEWRGVAWRGVAWRGVAWRGSIERQLLCVRNRRKTRHPDAEGARVSGGGGTA